MNDARRAEVRPDTTFCIVPPPVAGECFVRLVHVTSHLALPLSSVFRFDASQELYDRSIIFFEVLLAVSQQMKHALSATPGATPSGDDDAAAASPEVEKSSAATEEARLRQEQHKEAQRLASEQAAKRKADAAAERKAAQEAAAAAKLAKKAKAAAAAEAAAANAAAAAARRRKHKSAKSDGGKKSADDMAAAEARRIVEQRFKAAPNKQTAQKATAAPQSEADRERFERERAALAERRRRAAENDANWAANQERKRLEQEAAAQKKRDAENRVKEAELARQREASAKRMADVEARTREHERAQEARKLELRDKARSAALATLATGGAHPPPPHPPQPRPSRSVSPVRNTVLPSEQRPERAAMLEEHTRHLIAARLAAQQTMQAGERTVRTELTNVPPHMQPQSLDMHSIDEVLGVAQKQQSDLVTKVTTLQQFVEQLSAMAASDEPIVYLPPSNTPIDINVVRTECETMARQLREAAIELHDSSNVIGALQRAKTALQMLDGSAVASLQAQQAVEIAELNLQLEQEYVVAARLAAEGTLAKQHAVDSQAQVAYQREYASWQTAQTAFQAKLDKQIEAELRKLLLETQMTPSVAPAVAKPAAAVAMWHEASAVPAARAATERPAVARQPWRQEVTPAAPVAPEREPRSLEEMPELAVVECPICRRQFFARDLEVHTNVCIDRVHGLVQERPQDDADSDMLQAALQRSMEDQGALGNFEASRVSGGGAGSGGGGGGESDDVTSLLAQMFPTLPSQIIAMVWNSVHGDFDLAVSTLGPMQSDPEILQFNKKGGAKQGGRGFGGAKGSSSSSSASSSRGGRR